jgi:hypothetical protein
VVVPLVCDLRHQLQVPGQTPSKRHHATQQQQQRDKLLNALTTEGLLSLLDLRSPPETSKYRSTLKFWSDAVDSNNLADMLADSDALLTSLKDAMSTAADKGLRPWTAVQHLMHIERALLALKGLQEQQQQLLGRPALQQLPGVVMQVTAEKTAYTRLARQRAGAAAAAALAAGEGAAEEMLVDGDDAAADKAAAAAGKPDRAAAAAGSNDEEADDEDGQHMQIDGSTGVDAEVGEAAAAKLAAAAAAVDDNADVADAENIGRMLHAAAVTGDHNAGKVPAAAAAAGDEAEAAAVAAAAQEVGAGQPLPAAAAPAPAAALGDRAAAVFACRSAVVELTQQLDPSDAAVWQTDDYLTGSVLQLVNDSSSSVVQLQESSRCWPGCCSCLREVAGRWISVC